MSARGWIAGGVGLLIVVIVLLIAPAEAAVGWRAGFLTASAPVLGAALMLGIARVVGADWSPFAMPLSVGAVVVIAAALLALAGAVAVLPPQLAVWQHPLAVGIRAVLASGALWFAGARLARGASVSFAAVALALYVVFVTPIAFDWLLGGVPGHGVSAAGMMLAVEQVGGAGGLVLALGLGSLRFRRDMAKLTVAAALGLGYLAFMDYLIIWYGDLPHRTPFYVARGSTPMVVLAAIALLIGLAAPIAILSRSGDATRLRAAGVCALVGLWLFNLWWTAAGPLAALVSVGAIALIAGAGTVLVRRRADG